MGAINPERSLRRTASLRGISLRELVALASQRTISLISNLWHLLSDNAAFAFDLTRFAPLSDLFGFRQDTSIGTL
jgi:hypothetical protein